MEGEREGGGKEKEKEGRKESERGKINEKGGQDLLLVCKVNGKGKIEPSTYIHIISIYKYI